MASSPTLIEFPADDPERARSFWSGLLGLSLEPRRVGEGWESDTAGTAVGVHHRGRGPGDSFSLPYFEVDDLPAALETIQSLGGRVIHRGDTWTICKDSEGNPFGLSARGRATDA